MRKYTIILLILLTNKTYGQYDFEKYPAINFQEYANWEIQDCVDNNKRVNYIITIPNFFENNDTITFQITAIIENFDTSTIRLYRNNAIIQEFIEPYGIGRELPEPLPKSIIVEDINGDSLNDIKVLIPANGCSGLYNYYLRVVYLMQKQDGSFYRISFQDLMIEYINRPERDFDNDNNFEIITMNLETYKDKKCWVFNIYNLSENGLFNVNTKADYPIMVNAIWWGDDSEDNVIIEGTTRISYKERKLFSRELPLKYNIK